MSGRVYFAHPVTDYDTAREAVALMALESHFHGYEIVNPNTSEHDAAYKVAKDFSYWEDLARSCDLIVFMCMPGPGRLLGSGVVQEIKASESCPLFEIDRKTFKIERCYGVPEQRMMSLEQTRLVINIMRDWRMELLGR